MFYDLNHVRVNPQGELSYLFTSTTPLVSPNDAVNNAITFYKVDSSAFLGQWQALTPTTPLAWNESLYNAAVAHDQAMIAANTQSHQLPGEPAPGDRALNFGYLKQGQIGENIFAYSKSVFYGESGLLIDWGLATPEHRDNIMSPAYQEVGVGIVSNITSDPATSVGPLVVTQDFGSRNDYGNPNIVGVAFADTNTNGRYDAGEGLGGLTVTVVDASGSFIATTTTMSAGGYQVKVPAGSYTVTVSGTGFSGITTAQVGVTDGNIEVDAISGISTGYVNFEGPVAGTGPTLFVTGQDGQVYAQQFDGNGNSSSGYAATRPGAIKTMEVARDASNRTVLFIIGGDNQVYAQKFDATGNSASGYFLVSAGAVQAIRVGHDGHNNIELFVIGGDGQAYGHKFDANDNSIGGWFLVGVGGVKSIAVGRDGSNNPELFVIGGDDRVYAHKFDASGSPTGDYFLVSARTVRTLLVAHDAANNPMLFVTGFDSQVYALQFDSTGHAIGSSYFLVGAGGVKALQVGYDSSNNPELFVIGGNDQVYAMKFNASALPAGGYFLTQPGAVKSMAVGRYGTGIGKSEIFVTGFDNQVYVQRFDGSGNSLGAYTLTRAGGVTSLRAS